MTITPIYTIFDHLCVFTLKTKHTHTWSRLPLNNSLKIHTWSLLPLLLLKKYIDGQNDKYARARARKD